MNDYIYGLGHWVIKFSLIQQIVMVKDIQASGPMKQEPVGWSSETVTTTLNVLY